MYERFNFFVKRKRTFIPLIQNSFTIEKFKRKRDRDMKERERALYIYRERESKRVKEIARRIFFQLSDKKKRVQQEKKRFKEIARLYPKVQFLCITIFHLVS